jgi:hypothetical protein
MQIFILEARNKCLFFNYIYIVVLDTRILLVFLIYSMFPFIRHIRVLTSSIICTYSHFGYIIIYYYNLLHVSALSGPSSWRKQIKDMYETFVCIVIIKGLTSILQYTFILPLCFVHTGNAFLNGDR